MHVNHQFLYHPQEALNLLPHLTDSFPVTTQSSPSSTNDVILVVYLSNLNLLLRALHFMRWWIMRRQLGKPWLRTLAIKSRYAQMLDTAFLFLNLKPLMPLCPIHCLFLQVSVFCHCHISKKVSYTLDYGDDKSTKLFQPHFINSELFWRILCTQNDSNSLVYGYNHLKYYYVFFMNCLAYATILTAFYKGRNILATNIHPQRFQLACILL